jgi:hypothetical protein
MQASRRETHATHSRESPVSDPSELGSEPASWLEYSTLRARDRGQVRELRRGSHVTNGLAVECVSRKERTHTHYERVGGAVGQGSAGEDHDAHLYDPSQ